MLRNQNILFNCKLLVLLLYEIAATNSNTSKNTAICIVSSPCLCEEGIRLQPKMSHIGGIQESLRNGKGIQKGEGTFKKGEWQSFERKKIVFRK